MFQSRKHVVNITFRMTKRIFDLNIRTKRRRESLCCHNFKYRRLLKWRIDNFTKMFINNFLFRSFLFLFISFFTYFFSRKIIFNACATIIYVCNFYYDNLITFWLWSIFRKIDVNIIEVDASHAKQQQVNM